MRIIGAFDVHRKQITYKWLDTETGELQQGRTLVRLRKDLTDTHREWQQRLQAQFFHQGVPHIPVTTAQGRAQLVAVDLSSAGRQVVTTGLDVIDQLDRQLAPLDIYLVRFAKVQPGCRALKHRLFGVGDLTVVFIWAELGNCVRFSSSDDAVRYAGLGESGRTARGCT
jgi:transposase